MRLVCLRKPISTYSAHAFCACINNRQHCLVALIESRIFAFNQASLSVNSVFGMIHLCAKATNIRVSTRQIPVVSWLQWTSRSFQMATSNTKKITSTGNIVKLYRQDSGKNDSASVSISDRKVCKLFINLASVY